MNQWADAAAYGFLPEATGLENARALQLALDQGGTVTVSRPGIYKLAQTVYIGSNTRLSFSYGITVQKVDEAGPFSHVLLNKGALTRTWDDHISIENLHIQVSGMDVRTFQDVFGLHGQLAFFYARDVRITGFRCLDLGTAQYGIHICTFEDLLIQDVIIKGKKDGVHLGRGRRFRISDGRFDTYDDAVALNGHDYDVGNPELGWIEEGIIEHCYDLTGEDENKPCVGYFCRILAGAWTDWQEGMEVQKSDTVVSEGRLYRVKADPDEQCYISRTRPTHEKGTVVLDGISWTMVQADPVYTAGVRNVSFRNIYLHKARPAFSVHFDNDRFSRSYYPGAPVPRQENVMFEQVRVLHSQPSPFLLINTPVDMLSIHNCTFLDNPVRFTGNQAMVDYLPTTVRLTGCIFQKKGQMVLLENEVDGKEIRLLTSASVHMEKDFSAAVNQGTGTIRTHSDLKGLQ
jgi:riboflavin synthase alpha subunit